MVIGKKTNMQTKKSKTILKTVGQWDTKAVIVTQVRPTDSAINYQKKKKKQIKTMKIYQFFPSSRGCLYRTKDYILVFLTKKVCAKISFCAWCVQLWKNYLNDCALGSRQQGYRSYTGSFSTTHAICTLITKRQRYFIKILLINQQKRGKK